MCFLEKLWFMVGTLLLFLYVFESIHSCYGLLITLFLDYLHLSCIVNLMFICQAWFYHSVLSSSSAALLMCHSCNFDFQILNNICCVFFQLLKTSLKLKKNLSMNKKFIFLKVNINNKHYPIFKIHNSNFGTLTNEQMSYQGHKHIRRALIKLCFRYF